MSKKNKKRGGTAQSAEKAKAEKAFAEMMRRRDEIMRVYEEVMAIDLDGKRERGRSRGAE